MMCHYPDLGSASDWSYRVKFASTNQKHYPDLGSARHQYGISALVPQTSFLGESSKASRNVGCFLRLGYTVCIAD